MVALKATALRCRGFLDAALRGDADGDGADRAGGTVSLEMLTMREALPTAASHRSLFLEGPRSGAPQTEGLAATGTT